MQAPSRTLKTAFLFAAFWLSRRARWDLRFTIVTLVCGTIPIVSFWAEHRATARVRSMRNSGWMLRACLRDLPFLLLGRNLEQEQTEGMERTRVNSPVLWPSLGSIAVRHAHQP